MPSLPSQKGKGEASSVDKEFEITQEHVYLSRKMNISPFEVLQLPHSRYLALLKHNYIYDLQQTDEGKEYLEKVRRYQNPRKHADLSAIRSITGYQAIEKEGDSNG